jgi:hypothetical protein
MTKLSKARNVIVLPFVFLVAFGIFAIPSTISASASMGRGGETFVAHLSAAPGVMTTSTGEAIFHLSPDGTMLSYKLIVANINDVFMAHIHFIDGTIIVWLYPNPNVVDSSGQLGCIGILSGGSPSLCPGLIQGRFSGVLAQGTITAANLASSDCAGCNGFTFSELIQAIQSGNAFVNVHTLSNPAGEIQGFIN